MRDEVLPQGIRKIHTGCNNYLSMQQARQNQNFSSYNVEKSQVFAPSVPPINQNHDNSSNSLVNSDNSPISVIEGRTSQVTYRGQTPPGSNNTVSSTPHNAPRTSTPPVPFQDSGYGSYGEEVNSTSQHLNPRSMTFSHND